MNDHTNIPRDILIQREMQNDNVHVYLYYSENNETWAAYGKSAYALRVYAKAHNMENLRGFSKAAAMPCTITTASAVRTLKKRFSVKEEIPRQYILLVMDKPFDMEDYIEWVGRLTSANESDKEPIEVHTLVSDYVPKNEFIADNMNEITRNTKRIIDFLIASFCLIVFSPLMLIVYIAIKHEDHGPAIFKQERIGRFGHVFDIYKFRSMRTDAEAMGPQLSHGGGDDDPRLTKVGKFIRAHHLDELPQLYNVWKGDMAFIGYRPERQHFIDQIMEYDSRYTYLYQIRPGVTSYATLYNGYTDTMEKMLKRLEYDLYYLQHRSIWFDTKILWNTFASIVFGKKF